MVFCPGPFTKAVDNYRTNPSTSIKGEVYPEGKQQLGAKEGFSAVKNACNAGKRVKRGKEHLERGKILIKRGEISIFRGKWQGKRGK